MMLDEPHAQLTHPYNYVSLLFTRDAENIFHEIYHGIRLSYVILPCEIKLFNESNLWASANSRDLPAHVAMDATTSASPGSHAQMQYHEFNESIT